MKKILLTTVLFYFFLIQLNAQVTFGIKAGAGLSRQNYTVIDQRYDQSLTLDKQKTNYICVPVVSILLDIPISKTFSIRPEIGFRQQGYSYVFAYNIQATSISSDIFSRTFSARLNYLELPLNISAKLPFYKRKVEVLAGVTLGYCLGGRGTMDAKFTTRVYGMPMSDPYEKTTSQQVLTDKVDIATIYQSPQEQYVNPFNCNLNFGLGYKVNTNILLNAVFNYGLTNIRPRLSGEPYGPDPEEYRNAYVNTLSYSFTVAYMFGKKAHKTNDKS